MYHLLYLMIMSLLWLDIMEYKDFDFSNFIMHIDKYKKHLTELVVCLDCKYNFYLVWTYYDLVLWSDINKNLVVLNLSTGALIWGDEGLVKYEKHSCKLQWWIRTKFEAKLIVSFH